MAAPPIDSWEAEDLQQKLHRVCGLDHIKVRKHGRLLLLESGDPADAVRHARFKRDTVHLWLLEMPNSAGRWESTFMRGTLDNLTEALVNEFGWMVQRIE